MGSDTEVRYRTASAIEASVASGNRHWIASDGGQMPAGWYWFSYELGGYPIGPYPSKQDAERASQRNTGDN